MYDVGSVPPPPHIEWQVYTTTTKKKPIAGNAWPAAHATQCATAPRRSLASLSLFCDKILLLSCSQLAQYAATTFLSLCIIMSPYSSLLQFSQLTEAAAAALAPRTTDTQLRHKSKKFEILGRCGRQNMLRPYL